jgi:hypothetical protein
MSENPVISMEHVNFENTRNNRDYSAEAAARDELVLFNLPKTGFFTVRRLSIIIQEAFPKKKFKSKFSKKTPDQPVSSYKSLKESLESLSSQKKIQKICFLNTRNQEVVYYGCLDQEFNTNNEIKTSNSPQDPNLDQSENY